jgi:hypothetical protein
MLFDTNSDRVARERYNDLLKEAEEYRRVKALRGKSGVQANVSRLLNLLGQSVNWMKVSLGSQDRRSKGQASARLQGKLQ